MPLTIVHVGLPGPDDGETVSAACGAGPLDQRWSCSTVIEALEAAAEIDGRVCPDCLRAHGFPVAPDDDEADAVVIDDAALLN